VLGVRVTRQSQKISRNIIRQQKDPAARPHYWLDETISRNDVEPDSDYGAILARCISVTPLQVDRTHYPSLKSMSRWLPGSAGVQKSERQESGRQESGVRRPKL